jgi:hypothetical protein
MSKNELNPDKTQADPNAVPEGAAKVEADMQYAESMGSDDGVDGGEHPERPQMLIEEFGFDNPADANSPARVAQFLMDGNTKRDAKK